MAILFSKTPRRKDAAGRTVARRRDGRHPTALRRDRFPLAAVRPGRKLPLSRRLRLGVATAYASLQLPVARTWLDPMPLIETPIETLVLGFGGPGTGKGASILAPLVMWLDDPLILVDPQQNASERDVPLRRRIGRTVFIFNSEHADCASIDVLEGLDPTSASFDSELNQIADAMAPIGANPDHKEQRGFTQRMIKIALANIVSSALVEDETPLLTDLIDGLDPEHLLENLAHWAEFGVEDYRNAAKQALFQLSTDPEVMVTLSFFYNSELSWLGNPRKSSKVTGMTRFKTKASDIARDRSDVDWILEPNPQDLDQEGALWRLILSAPRRVRARMPESEARALQHRLWVVVDELPSMAGPGASLFNLMVVHDRQRGIRPVYLAQYPGQIEKAFGKDMLNTWLDAAGLVIYLQPTGDLAKEISDKAGETIALRRTMIDDIGAQGRQAQWSWEDVAAVPLARLQDLPFGQFITFYKGKNRQHTIIDSSPLWFQIPLWRLTVKRAVKAHHGALTGAPSDNARHAVISG